MVNAAVNTAVNTAVNAYLCQWCGSSPDRLSFARPPCHERGVANMPPLHLLLPAPSPTAMLLLERHTKHQRLKIP